MDGCLADFKDGWIVDEIDQWMFESINGRLKGWNAGTMDR